MATETDTTENLRERVAKLETELNRLSRQDQLTGLLNRVAFLEELEGVVGPKGKFPRKGALIEIAVRGIPRISGTLGRHVADYVISALAARINFMEMPDSCRARIDHSHFAVLLPHVNDALEAMKVAKEMLASLGQPVEWLDRPLTIDLAAGVALAADNDSDVANLVQNAELALKSAAGRGGPGYAFFNPALAQGAKRRNDVQLALQGCIEKNLLSLNYQPVFDAKSGALAGFEALMRLNSIELGPISPAEFIPAAEEAGFISRFGAWALADACRAAASWPQHLTVAVNISPEQFYSGTLVTDVHNALEMSSFPAYRLELEITESTLLKDSETVLSQLSDLREMGCAVVLDDFGTGYSSLSYLWKFPFTKLKMDRAFVNAMETTGLARGILQSIIGLANNLGLKVTAEGIETEAQANALRDLGAHYLQGFHLGRPVREVDLAAIVIKDVPSKQAQSEENRIGRSSLTPSLIQLRMPG